MKPDSTIVAELKTWVIEQALPLWATTGWDKTRGGFYEKLDFDGTSIPDAVRRLRVQARQIYVYAHAAQLGWYPEGLRIAMRGFEYMLDKGRSPDGQPGFVHLLHADGSTADARRDSYDHMFVLLAMAWLARVSGDAQVRAVLDETLAFVDSELTDGLGLLLEGKPASLPRRQNPNMHAFEAMMALHETLDYPGALRRAAQIRTRFETTFFDPDTTTIREFYTADWKRLPPPQGTSIEPGHLVEWTWLLRRYETLQGLKPSALASQLLDKALTTANPESGLLYDEADVSGAIRKPTSRSWLQTELAKAWLAETEAGKPGARTEAMAALEGLKKHYLDGAPKGCWIDQLDSAGNRISDHIPASTFYHVFLTIAEAERVLGQHPA